MLKVLLPLLLLLASCSRETPRQSGVPTYATIHHLTLPGAYFHFQHKGNLYLACSIHQGGTAPGGQLKLPDEKGALVLKKRVHTQNDLQVWTYTAPSLDTSNALPYTGETELQIGDRVFILNRSKKIPATIALTPQGGQFRYMFKTSRPFSAGGMSGSPIYSPRLGTVVGVLQVANHKKSATQGGFEPLNMP
ncbi:MAG: hypothetical protein ACSHYF_06205 [Verrucomicrobiaceae bacterium]